MSDSARSSWLFSPLVRTLAGIVLLGGMVFLVQGIRSSVIDNIIRNETAREAIFTGLSILLVTGSYIFLYRFYEKRAIHELAWPPGGKYALQGFMMAVGLQAIVIGIIFLAGHYELRQIHSLSNLFPGFFYALTAGFVGELLLRGVFYRLLEEMWGTLPALAIMAALFAVAHGTSPGASFVSVAAVIVRSGILLSLMYTYFKNLWFPIFFHFGWDLAEPTLFGAANPGITVPQSVLEARLTGPDWLTGGEAGPGNSLPAFLICALISLVLFQLALKKRRITPSWRKRK